MVCKRCGRGSIGKNEFKFFPFAKSFALDRAINQLPTPRKHIIVNGGKRRMCNYFHVFINGACSADGYCKPYECGLHRPESMSQIDKYNSLLAIIEAASGHDVF